MMIWSFSGCQSVHRDPTYLIPGEQPGPVAREQEMMTLSTYVIEPPDILLIDAQRLTPKEPYRIESLDYLDVRVDGTLPNQPINEKLAVEPSGHIDLGAGYGKVLVAGLTIDEAKQTVETHLGRIFRNPSVAMSVILASGQQQLQGEKIVASDGRVYLGTFGSVYIAGMTKSEATEAIKKQLSNFVQDPIISVDVSAYNSKVYYIISEGAGAGDVYRRLPITGNETVMLALSQIGGLNRNNSTHIWIARPSPSGCNQILEVNWQDITRNGRSETNYQLLPGDRIFVEEDRMLGLQNTLATITQPFESLMGFSLLGANTAANIQRFPRGFNGGQGF